MAFNYYKKINIGNRETYIIYFKYKKAIYLIFIGFGLFNPEKSDIFSLGLTFLRLILLLLDKMRFLFKIKY